jgi:CheY-like chemotaxis protein
VNTGPVRILLAEDNDSNMIVQEMTLHHLLPGEMARPVEVTCALDGLSAMRCLREGMFNLVVTDISMPGLDGWELLEQLRGGQIGVGPESTPRTVPVVIMAARSSSEDRASAMTLAAAYFAKPMEPRRFVEEMSRLLRASRPEKPQ